MLKTSQRNRLATAIIVSNICNALLIYAQQDEPLNPCCTPLSGLKIGFSAAWDMQYQSMKYSNASAFLPLGYDGSFSAYQFGALSEYIPSTTSSFSYQLKLSYTYSNPTQSLVEAPLPSLGQNGISDISYETRLETIINDIAITPIVKFKFIDQFSIIGGASIHFLNYTKLRNTFNVASPGDFKMKPVEGKVYENDYRTMVLSDESIPDADPVNVSVISGLSYKIDLKRLSVNPVVTCEYYFNKISHIYDWNIFSVNFGIDFVIIY